MKTPASFSKRLNPQHSQYIPSKWEAKAAFSAAGVAFGLTTFLIMQGKPFASPAHAMMMQILLSFAIAMFGALIPGFLNVGLTSRGISIRAGGALAAC